jgi:hypothetical protein
MDKINELIELSKEIKHYRYCITCFDTGDLQLRYWEGYGVKYAGAERNFIVDDDIREFAYRWYMDKVSELGQKRESLFRSLTPEEQLSILDR